MGLEHKALLIDAIENQCDRKEHMKLLKLVGYNDEVEKMLIDNNIELISPPYMN